MAPRPIPSPFNSSDVDAAVVGDADENFHDARETSTPPRSVATAGGAANGGGGVGTSSGGGAAAVPPPGRSPNRNAAGAGNNSSAHRSRRNQRAALGASGGFRRSSSSSNSASASAPAASSSSAPAPPPPGNADASPASRSVLVQAQRLGRMKLAAKDPAQATQASATSAQASSASASSGQANAQHLSPMRAQAGRQNVSVQQLRAQVEAQRGLQQQQRNHQHQPPQQPPPPTTANVELRTLFASLDLKTPSSTSPASANDVQSLIDSLAASLPSALNLGPNDADDLLYREMAEAMVRCRIRKRKAGAAAEEVGSARMGASVGASAVASAGGMMGAGAGAAGIAGDASGTKAATAASEWDAALDDAASSSAAPPPPPPPPPARAAAPLHPTSTSTSNAAHNASILNAIKKSLAPLGTVNGIKVQAKGDGKPETDATTTTTKGRSTTTTPAVRTRYSARTMLDSSSPDTNDGDDEDEVLKYRRNANGDDEEDDDDNDTDDKHGGDSIGLMGSDDKVEGVSSHEEWVEVSPTNASDGGANHTSTTHGNNNDDDGFGVGNSSGCLGGNANNHDDDDENEELNRSTRSGLGGLGLGGGNQDESVLDPSIPSDEEGEGGGEAVLDSSFASRREQLRRLRRDGNGDREQHGVTDRMRSLGLDDIDDVDDDVRGTPKKKATAAAAKKMEGRDALKNLSVASAVANAATVGVRTPKNPTAGAGAVQKSPHRQQRQQQQRGETAAAATAAAATAGGAAAGTNTVTAAATTAGPVTPQPSTNIGERVKGLRDMWEEFTSPVPPGTAAAAAAAAAGEGADGTTARASCAAAETSHTSEAGSGGASSSLDLTMDAEEQVRREIFEGNLEGGVQQQQQQQQRQASAATSRAATASHNAVGANDGRGWPNVDGPAMSDPFHGMDAGIDATTAGEVPGAATESNSAEAHRNAPPSATSSEAKGSAPTGDAAAAMAADEGLATATNAEAAASPAFVDNVGTDHHGFPTTSSPSDFKSPPSSPENGDDLDSSFMFSPPEKVNAAVAAGGDAGTNENEQDGRAAGGGIPSSRTTPTTAPAQPFAFATSPQPVQQQPQQKSAPHTNAKQGKMRRKVVGSATAGMFTAPAAAAPKLDHPLGSSAGRTNTAADPPGTAASIPTTAPAAPPAAAAAAAAAEQPSLFKVDLTKNKDANSRSSRRGIGGKGASSRGMRGSIRNINPGGLNINSNTGFGDGGFVGPQVKTPTDGSSAPESRPSLSPMDVEDLNSLKDDVSSRGSFATASSTAANNPADAANRKQSAAEAALQSAAARVAAEAAAANVDPSIRGSFSIGTDDQKLVSPGRASPRGKSRANRTKLRPMRSGNRPKVPTTPLAAADGFGTGTDDHTLGGQSATFHDPFAATQPQQQPPTQPATEEKVRTTTNMQDVEDFTGRDSHVDALRDEGRELYVQARYTESVVRYTAAIRAQTRNFTTTRLNADGRSDDAKLALLYGNRGAALMMVGGFDAAASDCQKALGNVPDEFGNIPHPQGIQAWDLRPESGPALRSKLLCRMGRALLKAGKIDQSEAAFDGAIRTSEAALSKYGRVNIPQLAVSVLDQSIADATLNKRDIQRSRDATAGILECCGGLPPNVAASGKKNGAQVLLHVNAALSTSPGDMNLHTQKIRLLAAMKCWADLASHAEHLAADCVRFDKVFVDDLSSFNPYPGTPPAKNLSADFFETNQDEDRAGTTGPRTLDAKAVCDAVLRLPPAVLPLYLRALRLEERYIEASRATAALDAHTRDTSTLTTRNLAWLSKEKGKLRRTTTTKESGDTLFRKGEYERAAAKYASCLLIDGEGIDAASMVNDDSNAGGRLHAVLHCNRAACYMALKNYREAVKECTWALLIHSTYMKAMLRRARCYARLDRHEEAIGEYQRWIEMVETAKRMPRSSKVENNTCYFDRPVDTIPGDLGKARKELSDVKKAKVAKAEADANEKARAERQQWYDANFRGSRAGAGNNDAYARRQQWYDQNPNGADGGARWDSFNGSSPKRPGDGWGARSQSYTNRGYGARPGGYQQRSQSQGRPRQAMGSPGSDLARTHYEVLEVHPNSTTAEIKKAYRKMALKYHPDKNKDPGAADIFRRVQLAYDTLSDDVGRRKYDAEQRLRQFGNF